MTAQKARCAVVLISIIGIGDRGEECFHDHKVHQKGDLNRAGRRLSHKYSATVFYHKAQHAKPRFHNRLTTRAKRMRGEGTDMFCGSSISQSYQTSLASQSSRHLHTVSTLFSWHAAQRPESSQSMNGSTIMSSPLRPIKTLPNSQNSTIPCP